MAADFEHMRATHSGFFSFWITAAMVLGVVALG